MHLLASSTKQRLQCCLLAVHMATNQLLRGLFPFPLYHACASYWLLSKDSWFTHYIYHVEMQLNDVIKSIGWYRAFVALPILIRYHQNSTNTNTGIGIGASLQKIDSILDWICKNHPITEIHFIAYHTYYSHTSVLSRHSINVAIDDQVCFYRWLFVDPVKP